MEYIILSVSQSMNVNESKKQLGVYRSMGRTLQEYLKVLSRLERVKKEEETRNEEMKEALEKLELDLKHKQEELERKKEVTEKKMKELHTLFRKVSIDSSISLGTEQGSEDYNDVDTNEDIKDSSQINCDYDDESCTANVNILVLSVSMKYGVTFFNGYLAKFVYH